MAQVFFHCSNAGRVLLNCCDAEVEDLTEAREQAAMVVRSLLAVPGPEDWRGWMLHISDDLGEELFSLPFASVMGRLH
jgi:hypothetical protein